MERAAIGLVKLNAESLDGAVVLHRACTHVNIAFVFDGCMRPFIADCFASDFYCCSIECSNGKRAPVCMRETTRKTAPYKPAMEFIPRGLASSS